MTHNQLLLKFDEIIELVEDEKKQVAMRDDLSLIEPEIFSTEELLVRFSSILSGHLNSRPQHEYEYAVFNAWNILLGEI